MTQKEAQERLDELFNAVISLKKKNPELSERAIIELAKIKQAQMKLDNEEFVQLLKIAFPNEVEAIVFRALNAYRDLFN